MKKKLSQQINTSLYHTETTFCFLFFKTSKINISSFTSKESLETRSISMIYKRSNVDFGSFRLSFYKIIVSQSCKLYFYHMLSINFVSLKLTKIGN